eukprot:13174361-Alexandrium_andersonii.AAC.1
MHQSAARPRAAGSAASGWDRKNPENAGRWRDATWQALSPCTHSRSFTVSMLSSAAPAATFARPHRQ